MMRSSNQKRDIELLRRVRNDQDELAKEELVNKYLPMVKHIIKKRYNYFYEYEDLIQEGIIALLKAIEDYDGINYSVKFSTFAYVCILRRILNVKKYFTCKSRPFYHNISLYKTINSEESRTLLDILEDSSPEPLELVIEKLLTMRLLEVLKAHLSQLEYTVIFMYLQGLKGGEISTILELESKTIDNARTRARLKLQKVIKKYGSLTASQIPLKTRKRTDLAIEIKAI